jgi:hypothetical protein
MIDVHRTLTVLALATLASACGGDDGGDTSFGTTGATAPTTTVGTESGSSSTATSTTASSSASSGPGSSSGSESSSAGSESGTSTAGDSSESGGSTSVGDVGDCCMVLDEAGCSNEAIAACVCKVDGPCCNTQWDDVCVGEVVRLGCAECPG